MNIASIWKLPVLFYCENNRYGMSAPSDKMISVKNVSDRASAYSMPGKVVDGNDFEAVYEAVKEAAAYIRAGNGPYLLEVMTYRFKGHSKSDRRLYRTSDEEQQWLLRDPILLFEQKMAENGYATKEEIEAVEDECRRGIELQAKEALKTSGDKLTEDEVMNLVYASREERP
jgi:TPP-dependent pyruvate/acetoin dehydrogenase alpha subunit